MRAPRPRSACARPTASWHGETKDSKTRIWWLGSTPWSARHWRRRLNAVENYDARTHFLRAIPNQKHCAADCQAGGDAFAVHRTGTLARSSAEVSQAVYGLIAGAVRESPPLAGRLPGGAPHRFGALSPG